MALASMSSLIVSVDDSVFVAFTFFFGFLSFHEKATIAQINRSFFMSIFFKFHFAPMTVAIDGIVDYLGIVYLQCFYNFWISVYSKIEFVEMIIAHPAFC